MGEPLSEDLRERVVRLYRKGGVTYEQVAELFEVGRASVSRFLRMDRLHGSVAPKKATGGPKTRLDASARAELVALVAQQPDATIEALTSTWAERHPDLAVSASTIGRALRQSGLTLKKKRSVRRRGAAKTW